jgi:ribosomal protein S8
MELPNAVKRAERCVDMATAKPNSSVAKSLKKAGFYGASKPKRLGIINKVTTKPQRIEMVDKLFLAKKTVKGKSK